VQKSWLNSYPPGVTAEIDVNEYASINEMLAHSCRKFSHRPALQNLGSTITYAGLDRLSRDFAAFLQGLPGLGKGSRVALMMPNLLQYPVALFGVLRAGMIAVNVNPLYTARELEHQLRDSGAEAIVILENFAHVLEQVLPNTPVRHVVTTQVGDLIGPPRRWLINLAVKRVKKMVRPWRIEGTIGFRAGLSRGAAVKLEEASLGPDDIALLQYTGGTTGTSKGAILTHGNLTACVLQGRAWNAGLFEEGSEVLISALPLYHIFALTLNCLFCVNVGGLSVLITNPRDLPEVVKTIRKSRFTMFTGVNTLFNGLLNTPGFDTVDFSRLRYSLGGGAAIQRPVAERWQAVTRSPLVEGYALTEAFPVACGSPLAGYSGSVGMPLPSTEVSIRDDHHEELPSGVEGEICVRGPQVTRGYWQRPEETRHAITADGWLRTGDIGVMDERGCIRITDRKKDMIIVSGFNVYPNEVESVIAAIPGVLECGVIGVPDESTGEAVKAFVVPKDAGLSAEVILVSCRANLTRYKVPKHIEFRGELPKNPIGKVLRRELRASTIGSRSEKAAVAR
jgi:long-chain acyl-CoA synthetase